MTEVFVMPLPAPANAPITHLALEVLAEIPFATLERVIRGYAHIELVKGQPVICPTDEESAKWITSTLNSLGLPIAYWSGPVCDRTPGNG